MKTGRTEAGPRTDPRTAFGKVNEQYMIQKTLPAAAFSFLKERVL